MTTTSAQKKLEKNGYKVTYTMEGNVIATKNNRRYSASSINGLIKIIF